MQAGNVKTLRNSDGWLDVVLVDKAGHMVPADQPAAALSLLDTVLAGQEFK